MTCRPDLGGFEVGRRYRHSETDQMVEYLGVGWLPDFGGQEVGLFHFIQGDGFVLATLSSHLTGEAFLPVEGEDHGSPGGA